MGVGGGSAVPPWGLCLGGLGSEVWLSFLLLQPETPSWLMWREVGPVCVQLCPATGHTCSQVGGIP